MKKIASLLLLLAFCFSFASCQMQFDNSMTDWEVAFELGGVNENGRFVYSSSSLRTMSAILCDGLTLIPDDDFSVKYRFFYYDENGVFLGHSAAMTDASSAKVPSKAVYAYIMLTPLDEYGMPLEKIDPLDVVDYAEKITVKINKKQSYSPNLVELAKRNAYGGAWEISELSPDQILMFSYFEDANIDLSDRTLKLSDKNERNLVVIHCEDVDSFYLNCEESENTAFGYYVFFNAEYEAMSETGISSYKDSYVKVPSEARYFLVESEYDMHISVYEYR